MRQKEIMMHILSILKNFRRLLSVVPALGLIMSLPSASVAGSVAAAETFQGEQSLLQGKKSLESGEYEKAIASLTDAYEKLPLLGDYALLWRSGAYAGIGDAGKAIEDLRTIKEKYKDSPLILKTKLREIELLKKNGDALAGKLMEGMVKEDPSNMEIKYAYAQYLKEHNKLSKAKDLFKEVFISACPLAEKAANELSPADISVDDLVKKGEASNEAWQFEAAEAIFRDALMRDKGQIHALQDGIRNGLAYSLFRQKRYPEAAEFYKKAGNSFGWARSIFRAGDITTFQAELPELLKTPDTRIARVLIAYGAKKRRDGNIDEAISIFEGVISRYPAAKEDALWGEAWTYYLSGDYNKAYKLLSRLAAAYGDPKYLYWSEKCRELLGDKGPSAAIADDENGHDFYCWLSCLKNKSKPRAVVKTASKAGPDDRVSERVDIMARIGLKDEAATELRLLSRKNPSPRDLVSISSYLNRLGYYNSALALILRVPYSDELHDLYYPLAFWPEVEEAAEATSLDPYLILSIMREESRFELDARSIVGAVGLMQLMPQTAGRYKKNLKGHDMNGTDLQNARTNILLGSYCLKYLLDKFGSIPVAIASYNGGSDAVSEWLKNGKYRTVDEFIEDIPYSETRNYVKKVLTTYFEYLRSNRDGDVSMARAYIGNL